MPRQPASTTCGRRVRGDGINCMSDCLDSRVAMVVVAGQSKAVIAFTCVTSTSADSKRLGQRHRLGLLVEPANQTSPVLSLVTCYTPQATSSRHTSCAAVHLPHLNLRPLPTVLPLAPATTAERRRRNGQTNLLRSHSTVDGHPRRLPRKLPSGSSPDLLLSERRPLSK
jgi:hypothetical protein